MLRQFTLLATVAFCVASAAAETRQMQLLNPDGTPATDAKAIAILTTPGAMVNQELKPLPFHTMDGPSPVKDVANQDGTISFDVSAKAVVAQNGLGFLFIPAEAFAEKAKLRPWANVRLDINTVPEKLRDKYRLRIQWTNNFAGAYAQVKASQSESAISEDWRFDRLISVQRIVEIKNEPLRLPPGEVTLTLVDAEHAQRVADDEVNPNVAKSVEVGFWQLGRKGESLLTLPEFGAVEVEGQLTQTGPLPDWGKAASVDRVVLHSAVNMIMPDQLKRLLTVGLNGDSPVSDREGRDRLAEYLDSPEGMGFRNRPRSAQTILKESERCRFDLVPTGLYSLCRLVPTVLNEDMSGMSVPLAKGTTILSAVPTGLYATVSPRETVDVTLTRPLHHKPESFGFHDSFSNSALPGQPAPNGLRRSASDPFGHDREYPFRESMVDFNAATIIPKWLQANDSVRDKQQLQQTLKQHLESEFTANQKSREAEIERLQQLINKAKEWLEQRNKNRDKIINKRVDELFPRAE